MMMLSQMNMFDPSCFVSKSTYIPLGWMALFFILLFLPVSYWAKSNQFKVLLMNTSFKSILPLSLFFFILVNNIMGLLPFTFVITAQFVVCSVLAFVPWMGILITQWLYSTNKGFASLIPSGTPVPFVPFIFIMEIISQLIRPLALSLRLCINITAGHVLMSLIAGVIPMATLFFLFELLISFIQAYVFSMLINMYMEDL